LRHAAVVVLTVVVAAAGSAAAQSSPHRSEPELAQNAPVPCVLDKCVGGTSLPRPPGATVAPPLGAGGDSQGNFDFYVLSLSWSPGFCATGGRKSSGQCDVGSGLGFVVHGLWPQYEHGFPSDCSPDRPVSQIALEQARGLYPDMGLARYEWRKHGTCSGKSPSAYFADVRRARAAITVPSDLQQPSQDLVVSPRELMTNFIGSNAGLRPDMIAIGCRASTLEEVRICFSKDLRSFRSCPEVSRETCRASQIQVPHIR
jgi:ribonuclease T2